VKVGGAPRRSLDDDISVGNNLGANKNYTLPYKWGETKYSRQQREGTPDPRRIQGVSVPLPLMCVCVFLTFASVFIGMFFGEHLETQGKGGRQLLVA